MFRGIFLIAMASLPVSQSVAQERHQLDAHVHGESALNIAIEGKVVEMELEAPGADIVGFEHHAESAADKAHIETAKAKLIEGDALFVLPADAGCAVEAASADLVPGGQPHHEGHEKDHVAGGSHTEFMARYRYGCADPDAISAIEFPFFKTFPRARKLVVRIINRTGSARYNADRDNPSIVFGSR